MRRLSIVLAAFALAFVAMPAATAHRSMLEVEFTGVGILVDDPGYLAERCPDGFQWVYQPGGVGTLETTEFSGPVEVAGEHCSRWINKAPTDPDRFYRGKVGAGVMTFASDAGDLVITYRGMFKFRGDLSIMPPEYVAQVKLFYTIDGEMSTGVFAGARGVGVANIIDKFEDRVPSFAGELRGPIHFRK